MLGEERQAFARKAVGDPGMYRLQALDRGEQAERAALCRFDQPGISAGERGDVALLDVVDDQYFGTSRVIERAVRLEMLGRRSEMEGAGAGVGRAPILARPKRGRGYQNTVRRRHDGGRKRFGRIEPATVDRHIKFASVNSLDRQPVDEFGIGLATNAAQQRNPRR